MSALSPAGSTVQVVALATAAQGLIAACTAALPSIAPLLAGVLRVDAALIGVQASLVYGVAMLSALASGALVRRWGATRTVQFALAADALGLAIAAIPTLPTVALGGLLLGIGLGITTPATAHILARYTPAEQRNLVFSIKQAGVPFGAMVAALLTPAIAVGIGWQVALGLLSVVCALLAVALQRRRAAWDDDRDPRAGYTEQPFGGVPLVWRRPALRWLVLAGALFNVMHVALNAFTVNLLVKDAGYALVLAGTISALAQFGGMAGRVLLGYAADRTGHGLGIVAGCGGVMVAACLLTALIGTGTPLLAVALLFLAFGAAGIGWNGVYHAQLAMLAPHGQVGLAASGGGFFMFLAAFIGPSVYTLIHALTGSYTSTFAVGACIPVAGVVLTLLAMRALRRSATPATS